MVSCCLCWGVQDVVAGDGTTSVVVICGALLKKAQELLQKSIHPTVISDSFNKAANKACEVTKRYFKLCSRMSASCTPACTSTKLLMSSDVCCAISGLARALLAGLHVGQQRRLLPLPVFVF